LDWTVSFRASSRSAEHFNELEILRLTIGVLYIAFVFFALLLMFVLLRWHNTIFRERAQKARVIKEVEEARRQAELARDSKTDFMAFLCHELRNPLHACLAMSDLLRDSPLDSEQTDAVFTIHASSELMRCIVDDILDFSKIQAGRIELEMLEIDLYALLDSLVRANNMHGQERSVTVKGRVDPRVPRYIVADPTRLNQMLGNLISNGPFFFCCE
jgi:signal transduction histidine kinase